MLHVLDEALLHRLVDSLHVRSHPRHVRIGIKEFLNAQEIVGTNYSAGKLRLTILIELVLSLFLAVFAAGERVVSSIYAYIEDRPANSRSVHFKYAPGRIRLDRHARAPDTGIRWTIAADPVEQAAFFVRPRQPLQ